MKNQRQIIVSVLCDDDGEGEGREVDYMSDESSEETM